MTVRNKFALCVTGIAIALCMMVVGVLAVIPQTITMKGTIYIDVPDRTLYLRDARVQYGDQEPTTVQGFRKGYIYKNFQLKYDLETDSDTIKLYFDIVNLIIDGQTTAYKAETSWTDGEVSGVSFNIDPNNKTIAAGTVNAEDFTSSTPISGTIVLEININNSQNFDLSNITILIIGADKTYLPNADYTIDGGNITINGIGGASGDVDIPEKVSIAGDGLVEGDDYTVTSIGNGAFANNSNIQTVTLPETITSIGSHAFSGCSNLTSINLPEGITSIDYCAFMNCTSLTEIVLPSTLTTIGTNAFYNCRLVSGTLNIPASVTTIGVGALALVGLNKITVDEGSQHFTAVDGILYSKDMTRLVVYPLAKASENFVVPESVEVIEERAFYQSANIQGTLTLSSKLTTIGDAAFFYCQQLTDTLNIPASVTSIGETAFSYCRFTEFVVDENNTAYVSDSGVLYNTAKTILLQYPRGKTGASFVIPSTVTRIYGHAFASCSNLTSVTLPSNLQTLGNFVFLNCTNLTGDVVIPSTVTSMGWAPFSNTKITSFSINNAYFTAVDGVLYNAAKTTLLQYPCGSTGTTFAVPDGVTAISNNAFYNAANLTSITISSSVSSISDSAFNGCDNLATVYIDSPTVAAMLTSKSAATGLIQRATTVYVSESAVQSLPSAFASMFSETTSDVSGFKKYTAV